MSSRSVSHGRRRDQSHDIPVNAVVLSLDSYRQIDGELSAPLTLKFEAAKLSHEQAQLSHDNSVAKVATWKNTVQANRRSRLQAAQVKAEQAEEARVQQDTEWHQQLVQEKKAFLESAQMMQLYETPEVRALHSKLNVMRVLEERDMQVEIGHKKKQYHEEEDSKELLYKLEQDQFARAEELQKGARGRKVAAEFQKGLDQQVNAKLQLKQREAEVKESLRIAQAQLLVDYQQSEGKKAESKVDQRHDLVEGFQVAVQEHQKLQNSRLAQSSEFLQHAEIHRNITQKQQDAMKAVIQSETSNRIARTEHVSVATKKTSQEEELKKTSFMSKWAVAQPFHDYAGEQERIIQAFKQHRIDNMGSAAEQIHMHQESKDKEEALLRQFIQMRNDNLQRLEAEAETKKQNRATKALALANDHKVRVARHQEEAAVLKSIEEARHRDEVDHIRQNRLIFERYADSVISHERSLGHDTHLLENVLLQTFGGENFAQRIPAEN